MAIDLALNHYAPPLQNPIDDPRVAPLERLVTAMANTAWLRASKVEATIELVLLGDAKGDEALSEWFRDVQLRHPNSPEHQRRVIDSPCFYALEAGPYRSGLCSRAHRVVIDLRAASMQRWIREQQYCHGMSDSETQALAVKTWFARVTTELALAVAFVQNARGRTPMEIHNAFARGEAPDTPEDVLTGMSAQHPDTRFYDPAHNPRDWRELYIEQFQRCELQGHELLDLAPVSGPELAALAEIFAPGRPAPENGRRPRDRFCNTMEPH